MGSYLYTFWAKIVMVKYSIYATLLSRYPPSPFGAMSITPLSISRTKPQGSAGHFPLGHFPLGHIPMHPYIPTLDNFPHH